jgi:hypothetical protein
MPSTVPLSIGNMSRRTSCRSDEGWFVIHKVSKSLHLHARGRLACQFVALKMSKDWTAIAANPPIVRLKTASEMALWQTPGQACRSAQYILQPSTFAPQRQKWDLRYHIASALYA